MYPDQISRIAKSGNKSILLYGMPGTEKLKIAMHTACSILDIDISQYARCRFDPVGIVSDKGCWEILSMHPGCDYVGFVGEKNPAGTNNNNFRRGYFSWICKKAGEMRDLYGRNESSRNFVLILDGIEKVNLPDMFGELLQALDYRDVTVTTMFSRSISVPDNIYIIALANIASPRLLPKFSDIVRFFTPVNIKSDMSRLPALLSSYNIPDGEISVYVDKCTQLNNTITKIVSDALHIDNIGIGQEFLAKIKDYMIKPTPANKVTNNIDSALLVTLWNDIIDPLIYETLGSSYFRSVSKLDAAKNYFIKL